MFAVPPPKRFETPWSKDAKCHDSSNSPQQRDSTSEIRWSLPARSKHSMADPMAVSSWKTGALLESRGLTVFLFLMSGRSRAPPDLSRVALSCSRATHRLLVLKYLWGARRSTCKQQLEGSSRRPYVRPVRLPPHSTLTAQRILIRSLVIHSFA